MNRKNLILISAVIIFLPALVFSQPSKKNADLKRSFNLAGKRLPEKKFYIVESKFENIALNGKRSGFTVYKLFLKCTPSKLAGQDGDVYTCSKFLVNTGDTAIVEIPALKDWSYVFGIIQSGIDEKGQLFGIDHAKFENLVDGKGKRIPQDKAYMTYNTFIDFHTFCNVFAEKTFDGGGIQKLKKIGDRIIHSSANSQPPLNLGSNISEVSYFKNGEITLTFKGLSLVNKAECALVGFDSGESSFYIRMQPSSDLTIETKGGSHYKGDLYIDLKTYWIKKVIMDEFVVAETKLPFPPATVHSVTERNTVVRDVSEKEFNME